jgi:predicted transcriptional regulator
MTRRLVDPTCHEFAVNLNFNQEGLSPWFAANRVVDDVGGGTTVEDVHIDAIGEQCDVSIRYQEGNLSPPDGGETPAGTSVEFETIREPRIHVASRDGHSLRSVDYHMRPRWDDLEAETKDGRTVSIPDGGLVDHTTDGISIRATGSNVDFAKYPEILREAADALGISSHYFTGFGHRTSNIQDAARYVRVAEDHSGPIHARDGPIVGLAHVLEDDRDGYRKLVQNDSDERHHKKPGMYHTVTLGPKRVREVWPDHQLPVEIKHYYKEDYHDRTDGLRHPKLEVAYQTSRSDETTRYDPETIAQVKQELDECIYSVVADAGIDLRGGPSGPFVADEIFDAESTTTDASIIQLNLTQIKHEQQAVVFKNLGTRGGLSPIQQEAVETLVTDGGEVSPAELAEAHDRHIDAVYRALEKMDDIIDREYGRISLRSTYVAELVHDAIQVAEDAVTRAARATSKALSIDDDYDERTSAFLAFLDIHQVEFDDSGGVSIDFGDIQAESVSEARREVRRLLREGFKLWRDMNRDPLKFKQGTYAARAYVPTQLATLKSTDDDSRRRQSIGGQCWRAISGT